MVEIDTSGADARLTIAGREVRSLLNEKTILLALVIQLFVAAFSSFLVVGLVSLYDPGGVGGVTIDVAVAGDDADDLVAAVEQTDGLRAREFESRELAIQAFEAAPEAVDAAMVANSDGAGGTRVRVLVPDSNIQTTVVVVQARQALRTYERAERADNEAYLEARTLELPPRMSASPYFGFTYTVLVPLLLFLPVFIAGSITVDSLTEELDRGTMELLRVAPVTTTDIVEGKLLAAAGLAPLQAVLWMLLLSANGTPVANLPSLIGLVAGAATVVVVLGATIALTAPDRRAAQTIYSLGVLGVFGVTAVGPVNPVNVAARLAIGTAGLAQHLAVGGVLVVGLLALLGARRVLPRYAVGG
ncbi:ABC transporter permease [Halobaculum sp. MBLA0147]|uniref:ABC transporter permease n=1 Tax=Halobaculum sp. MBLA0147 TaxID=3079934 RepID=UPI003524BB71